jgi:hypothetical protein
VTTLLVMVGAGVAAMLLTAAAVVRMWRGSGKPGGRDGLGSIGDAFGNFIDVFDPGQARAQRDLKHQQHQGPVTPSPDDENDPVRLLNGPDGRPRAVRIRTPRPLPAQPDSAG